MQPPIIVPLFVQKPRFKSGDIGLYFKTRKDAETWIEENQSGSIGWSSPSPICVCTLQRDDFVIEQQERAQRNRNDPEITLVVIPQS